MAAWRGRRPCRRVRFDARVHQALGQIAEAAAELADFAKLYAGQPTVPAALLLQVQLAVAQQDWPAAQTMCRALGEAFAGQSEEPQAWLAVGAGALAAGQRDVARTALTFVETNFAGQAWSEQAALQLIEMQLAQGEQTGAVAKAQALLANTNVAVATRAAANLVMARLAAAVTIQRKPSRGRTGASRWRRTPRSVWPRKPSKPRFSCKPVKPKKGSG